MTELLIDDLDRTLETLLRDKVPLPATEFDISFQTPTEAWSLRSGERMRANLYLYEVRENHDHRDLVPRVQQRPEGGFVKRRAPARVDLFYLVTTWSPAKPPEVLAEHRLLGALLGTLLRYPTLPREHLQGSLIDQESPLPTMVAQPDGGLPQPPSEFWSAIGNKLRPALNFVVTVAVEPRAFLDPVDLLPPVASRASSVGAGPARIHRLSFSPPLGRPLTAGAPVRSARVSGAPPARLDAAVFGSDRELRVDEAGALRRGDWVLLDDAQRTEFTRVEAAGTPGPGTVAVDPQLRFEHAAGVAVARVTPAVTELTRVAAAAAVAAQTLTLDATEGLAAGSVIMLDTPPRAELAIVDAVLDAARVALREGLALSHPAGASVRKATVDPLTQLAEPVNRPATSIDVSARTAFAPVGALGPGSVIMIGAGPDAEFARLGEIPPEPSRTVGVTPPLRRRHSVGSAVVGVTAGEVGGALERPAPAGAEQVFVTGTPPSVGTVMALGPEPAGYHRCFAVEAGGNGLQGAETTYAIGGLVTDEADPPTAIPGAGVELTELGTRAWSDAAGRFVFAGVPAGSFELVVVAAGYGVQRRVVRVPSTGPDEYRVRMEAA